MKRTFTFLMSLFLTIGAMWAQTVVTTINPDKHYTIECRSGYAHNTNRFIGDNGTVINGQSAQATYFKFEEAEGGYYILSVISGRYLNSDGSTVTASADTKTVWKLNAPSHTSDVVTFEVATATDKYLNNNGTKSDGTCSALQPNSHAGGPGSGNACSLWELCEYDEVAQSYKITYNFKFNEEVKLTQTAVAEAGAAYPDYNVEFPFGVVAAAKPEGVVEGETTVDIALSVDLPFEYGESYEDVEENWKWNYLLFHSNSNNYLYYDASLEYLDATKTTVDKENEDAYTWAFIGNPFDGFKVVNRLAGADKVLSSAAEPTTDKEYPVMTDISAVTGNTSWDLTASTWANNGFYMAYDGTSKRLNKQDNKVCYWLNGADAGSTFMVEIRPTEDQLLAALIEQANELLEVNMENIAAEGTVPAIGQYTWEAAMELMNAVYAEEPTAELLEAAITAFVTSKSLPVFTIDGVIDYAAGKSIYENETGGLNFKATDLAEEAMLWAFDMTENTVGVTESVVVRNLATGNLFWGAPSIKITETSDAVEGEDDGIFLFYTEGNATPIHAQNNGQAVVRWSSTEATSGSAWKFTYVGTTVELYDIDFTTVIEGTEWSDANAGQWPVIMNADLTESWNDAPSDWGLKNSTSYDMDNGIVTFEATDDRFVVDENGKRDTAAYLNQGVSFDPGRYRLTGKAYYKNSLNAEESCGYMVIGEHKLPVKAVTGDVVLGTEHEIVYEFTVEGEFQYGMLMPEYLNVGYACDFQNSGDVFVVGGFKIETIKDVVVPSVRESFLKAYQGDMMAGVYGFNYYAYDEVFMNFTTMFSEYNALLADVNSVADAVYGEQKILKAKVEKATMDMQDMVKSISDVTSYAMGDEYWNVSSTAAGYLKGLNEASAAYAAIDKAAKDVKDLASVTSADDLKARVAAVGEAVKMIPTEITLTQDEVALNAVGATVELTATVAPEETADKAVVWSTSDEAVAIVDENGKVTAVANGTASIIATTVNGLADTCKVLVATEAVIEVTEIKIATDKGESYAELLEKGATLQLVAEITPADATDKTITWSSDNELVTVDENGLVTLTDYCPEIAWVTITATAANGVTGTFGVNVYAPVPGTVTGITLNATWKDLEVKSGDTFQLVATVLPEDATDKTVTWSSSADFATVDENGLVTFTGTPEDGGVVTITATASNGMTATCMMSVTFVADDTAIDSINANAKAVIYDIHGRRVEKMEKGIYIVNGKKVIVK